MSRILNSRNKFREKITVSTFVNYVESFGLKNGAYRCFLEKEFCKKHRIDESKFRGFLYGYGCVCSCQIDLLIEKGAKLHTELSLGGQNEKTE